jgi:hypothetical protein
MSKESLRGRLPWAMPEPCPICGRVVYLTEINEWTCEEGEIVGASFDCGTKPDIDSDEWDDWHSRHYAMPYVDWMPWEQRALRWLNERYHYRETEA